PPLHASVLQALFLTVRFPHRVYLTFQNSVLVTFQVCSIPLLMAFQLNESSFPQYFQTTFHTLTRLFHHLLMLKSVLPLFLLVLFLASLLLYLTLFFRLISLPHFEVIYILLYLCSLLLMLLLHFPLKMHLLYRLMLHLMRILRHYLLLLRLLLILLILFQFLVISFSLLQSLLVHYDINVS